MAPKKNEPETAEQAVQRLTYLVQNLQQRDAEHVREIDQLKAKLVDAVNSLTVERGPKAVPHE